MTTYDCDDFRVSFARGPADGYSVIAVAADGRQVQTTFTLPMSSIRLEEAVIHLGQSRSREVAPEIETVARTNAEQLGGALAVALFDDTLGPFFDQARRSAAGNNRGLRLTLSLASTPELLSVPWELLYRRPTFLASQRRTPIVRYLEVGDLPLPLQIEGPVRILGVVASPTGLPELDVTSERARVKSALAGMVERDLVTLDWCDPATPRSLRERLRDGSFHILHFVGHSDFTADGDGLLFLVNEAGGPAQVTEAVLTNLLGDQTSLRLAILNSCEGARSTLTDPFAGIATSLVALGVPAVIAMQFTISDRAAIVFAEELFTSLIGRQYPVDAAVSEARKAVFTEVNEIEWATPVLFLRSDDGQLFDFTTAPTPLPLVVPPTSIVDGDSGGSITGLQTTPQQQRSGSPSTSRRRRTMLTVVAASTAVAAIVGALIWQRSDDDQTTSASGTSTTLTAVEVAEPTTELSATSGPATPPGTTPLVTTETTIEPPTVIPATVPFPVNTTTCNGQNVPPRPAPTALTADHLLAFQKVQEWADLLGQAQPGVDNTTLYGEMLTLFPDMIKPSSLEDLTTGYGNMAVDHLVDPEVVLENPLTFNISSLVYDNPTANTVCRTMLLCVTSVFDTAKNEIASYTWTKFEELRERWWAATDIAPASGEDTVAEWLRAECDRTRSTSS